MTNGLNIALNVDLFVFPKLLKCILGFLQLVFTSSFFLGLDLCWSNLLEHFGEHVVLTGVYSNMHVLINYLFNEHRGRV